MAAAIAAAVAWWVLARGTEVKVAPVVRGDAAAVVYATGIVEPVHWAKVAALQRKRIVELCRCEGLTVRKGDVLARLDDAEERAVLTELEARLKRYREDAERLKGLVERNVTARTTYEEKLTQVREQESRVAAQKDRIEDLSLKAPMDGVVLRRDSEVGEIAGTGTNDVLLWVGEPKPLRVVAEVNEEDILKVEPGQKVLLRHEGNSGVPLVATIDSITPKGDPQTKTFRVYMMIPEQSPLRIGMSVEANIVIAEAKDVLLVPAEAIGGSAMVLTVDDGRVRRRKIETGIRGTRLVEVRSGLTAGQRVVAPWKNDLSDGARVRIVAGAAR
ncbi:MAG: efflux RND transporter periplasmic adaptor subunit [Hyphomicrobiaceae bacterium]|nr:efflux RND transporter periplasmic adaptor subunit [Hyphomicrobiaceae bacterium]